MQPSAPQRYCSADPRYGIQGWGGAVPATEERTFRTPEGCQPRLHPRSRRKIPECQAEYQPDKSGEGMLVSRLKDSESEWVFAKPEEVPMLVSSLDHIRSEIRETLKLNPEFVIHSLRHAHALGGNRSGYLYDHEDRRTLQHYDVSAICPSNPGSYRKGDGAVRVYESASLGRNERRPKGTAACHNLRYTCGCRACSH